MFVFGGGTYIWLKFMVNIGKYSVPWSIWIKKSWSIWDQENQSRIEEHPFFLIGGEGSPYHGNFVLHHVMRISLRDHPFELLPRPTDTTPSKWIGLRTPSTQKKNIFHNTNLATQILLQLLPRDPD